jgi:hypothetical protein
MFLVYDCGKPWFTLEAYQVVIKAQIEFLIKIGVDPAIKVEIMQLIIANIAVCTIYQNAMQVLKTYS